jgi:hypothetical protein
MRVLILLLVIVAACNSTEPAEPMPGYDWTFSDELAVPDRRGGGGSARVCQPVTNDTRSVEVAAHFLPVPEFGAASRIRFLVFEYDSGLADAPALCVGGGVFEVSDSPESRSFDVPDDRSDLGYYVTVHADIDGNGELDDSCVDYSFQTFESLEGDSLDIVVEPYFCD